MTERKVDEIDCKDLPESQEILMRALIHLVAQTELQQVTIDLDTLERLDAEAQLVLRGEQVTIFLTPSGAHDVN